MRLFIAADINQRAKDLIANKVEIIKKDLKDNYKWVKKENWHLTIKFLGKSSQKDKENIIKVLNKIEAYEFNKSINFNQINAFPDNNQAKVIFAAVDKGSNYLKFLHSRIEKSLLEFDFKKDQRKYIPHLTLARSKNKIISLNEYIIDPEFINIYAQIKRITLYQSKLKNMGPEYIKLFSIK